MLEIKYIRKIGGIQSEGFIRCSLENASKVVKGLIKNSCIILGVEYIKEA